jgi:hypothetical protein
MNSDPLQRRMFAQQIINQHTRANQPMGILASSPQLMGAVQRFKDGGAVKGYDAGGGTFFKNYSTSPLANMIESIAGGQNLKKVQKVKH